MFVIIAQGDGNYGSAMMTTSFTRERLIELFKDEEQFTEALDGGDEMFFVRLHSGEPCTTIIIRERWTGYAQPNPVLISDSGHGVLDLSTLADIETQLATAANPPVDTSNKFLVGVQGGSIRILKPITGAIPKADAINLAANIVALAEAEMGEEGGEFHKILEALKEL
jgi:hypothetical protein